MCRRPAAAAPHGRRQRDGARWARAEPGAPLTARGPPWAPRSLPGLVPPTALRERRWGARLRAQPRPLQARLSPSPQREGGQRLPGGTGRGQRSPPKARQGKARSRPPHAAPSGSGARFPPAPPGRAPEPRAPPPAAARQVAPPPRELPAAAWPRPPRTRHQRGGARGRRERGGRRCARTSGRWPGRGHAPCSSRASWWKGRARARAGAVGRAGGGHCWREGRAGSRPATPPPPVPTQPRRQHGGLGGGGPEPCPWP